MRSILARAKKIAVILVRELIPAPTIGRLQRLRRFVRNPVKVSGRKVAQIASRRLSPQNYLKLRSFYFKYLKGGAIDPLTLVRKTQKSAPKARPKPITVKIDNIVYMGRTYSGIADFLSQNSRLKCDVVVCCAYYGRFEILDLVLQEGTHGNGGDEALTLFCLVGSTDEDREFLERVTRDNSHVFGVIAENHPVGRKWQTSVQVAYELCDFDLLGITGSDDILSSHLLNTITKRHRENIKNAGEGTLMPALYATMEWLIFAKGAKQQYTPQIVKCNYRQATAIMPIGGGRFYSHAFIDKVKGVLFDVKRDKLLDDRGFELITSMGMGVEYYGVEEGSVFNVKGDWVQMNEFDAIASAQTVDVQEYSFEGYRLLKEQLTEEVFEEIFMPARARPSIKDAA